jgi:hypothetical protein
MKSWMREPKSPFIKQYVECYWFLEKEKVSDLGVTFHIGAQQSEASNLDICSHSWRIL